MQKLSLSILLIIGFYFQSHAQFTRYIVKFKDKGGNPFSLANPSQYLTQRALARRARFNIQLDSTDLPVTPRYVDSLRLSGNVTILNISKWLNQVAIQTTDAAALVKINNFPFVISAGPIASRFSVSSPVNKQLDVPNTGNPIPTNNIIENTTGLYNYGSSNGQVKIHHTDFLHNHGFRGEGMVMAMLDAGFFHYLSLPTFDSIRSNNQILGTWDFVDNEASVDEDYNHGMQCLSTIAANIPGTFIGTAPKTSFYLYRTEDVSSEFPIEEQNWAAGMERADSLGVDITSTSLGYFDFDGAMFDYTYNDMDGNTTISAKAADLAAKKGMLLVNAAGNEGGSTWHYLITPSDADSVLSVGAVDTLGNVASFSSYGPSSDGQVKPAVAAVGRNAVVASTTTGLPTYSSGTSFACPNMAGVTTCLWQAFPEINNMGIIDALQLSATRSSDPDDRVGYGIPDVKKAFVILQKRLYSGQPSITDCDATLQFNVKTDATMSIDIERKLEAENIYSIVSTLQNTDAYGLHNFSYNDDLKNIPTGPIRYRYKVSIAADTSFYLDSVTLNHAENCNGIAPSNDITIVQQSQAADNININISRTAAARVNIIIQNAAGQKMYGKEVQQPAGIQTYLLPLKQILASRGAYFVTVFIDNKKAKTKEILRP